MAGGGRRGGGQLNRAGKGSAGDAGTGGGAGELVGRALDCPETLSATLVGPVPNGCAVGDILDVVRMASPAPPRVVCVHRSSRVTVGAIGGVPGLGILLECLERGVNYEALVESVAGGRVDVAVRKI